MHFPHPKVLHHAKQPPLVQAGQDRAVLTILVILTVTAVEELLLGNKDTFRNNIENLHI